jgi:hypothetical protein
MWIGLVQSSPGYWKWLDGSRMTWVGFGAVDLLSYDTALRGCGAVNFARSGGGAASKWVNANCSVVWPFMCEVKAAKFPPAPPLLTFAGVQSPPPPSPRAEPHFRYRFTAGQYEYELSLDTRTYAEAVTACALALPFGELASFPSPWDYSRVVTLIQAYLQVQELYLVDLSCWFYARAFKKIRLRNRITFQLQ